MEKVIETFELKGVDLPYFDHPYNSTRVNERAVEVSAALHLLGRAKGKEVLEVGAVLPHYLQQWPMPGHTVVDLYEQGLGIINENVLSWQPPKQYDLIISISTLEHLLGPLDFWMALEKLRGLCAPDGMLFVTLPANQPPAVGKEPWLDGMLTSRFVLEASELWRLDKVDAQQHLWQYTQKSYGSLAYNYPAPCANTVYLLFFGDIKRWWN